MLCSSGFVGDVMFARNRRRVKSVYRVTHQGRRRTEGRVWFLPLPWFITAFNVVGISMAAVVRIWNINILVSDRRPLRMRSPRQLTDLLYRYRLLSRHPSDRSNSSLGRKQSIHNVIFMRPASRGTERWTQWIFRRSFKSLATADTAESGWKTIMAWIF